MKNYMVMMVAGLLCLGCDTGTKYQFATYVDAKSDQTVLGASVPEFTPESARDIYGWFYIETNEHTTEFTFAESDKLLMIASFSLVRVPKATCARASMLKRTWSDIQESNRFEFYSREDSRGLAECLGIDVGRSHAYFWNVLAK